MKMKIVLKYIIFNVGLVFIGIHILGSCAFAAENSTQWRPTYDLVMRFVNFLILAFILVKVLKNPLLNFLKLKKDTVAQTIDKMEQEKQQIETKTKETLKQIDESSTHIEKLKEKIKHQGEKEKEKIIQEAKEQSQYMLNDAKKRVDSQIMQAKEMFKAELIDAAIDVATNQLPKEISKDDNKAFVDNYLKTAFQKN